METFDWSQFTRRIDIRASVHDIYRLWATQAGLEKWFLRKAESRSADGNLRELNEFFQKGDAYLWLWHGYGDETAERGEILEANGHDFLQFSFAGNCIVSIRVKEEQGEMVVELKQENIGTDERSKELYHIGCSTGWTFYLANLKSVLESGHDLRNKNEQLKNMVNA
jgi:uncharacterized protein YndB with AHSA1/START domain